MMMMIMIICMLVMMMIITIWEVVISCDDEYDDDDDDNCDDGDFNNDEHVCMYDAYYEYDSIHTHIYTYITIVQSTRSAGIASRDEDWSSQLTG